MHVYEALHVHVCVCVCVISNITLMCCFGSFIKRTEMEKGFRWVERGLKKIPNFGRN